MRKALAGCAVFFTVLMPFAATQGALDQEDRALEATYNIMDAPVMDANMRDYREWRQSEADYRESVRNRAEEAVNVSR